MDTPYPDLDRFEFTHGGLSRTVFRTGMGPAVIVMHEVPGLYPEVVDFGRAVAAEGLTVFMPSLAGTPGRGFSLPYNVQTLLRVCIAREFTVFATRRASAITEWLRALARQAHTACGGPGVGAVGMCLTGGFALAMMLDDALIAPVLSQPSLPAAFTAAQKRDLGLDGASLTRVAARSERDGVCLMALRFTRDRMVPAERFDSLRRLLKERFIAVEIDSSWGNPHGIKPWAHSVLVHDYVDAPDHPTLAARRQVMGFFRSRLLPD